MSSTIPEWLLDTGILQFGHFVFDDTVAPVRFCPEYLPAYPQLLAEVGKLALGKFNALEVDHLIASADSVPLGLVCSLQTGLPLVYSRGRGEAAVYDLVGSYNSGHICTLLLNSAVKINAIQKFILNARSVGLQIQTIVTLLELRKFGHLGHPAEIPIQSLFQLGDLVPKFVTTRRLSKGQAHSVMNWIETSES